MLSIYAASLLLYDKGTAHTSRTGNKLMCKFSHKCFFNNTGQKGSDNIKHVPKTNSDMFIRNVDAKKKLSGPLLKQNSNGHFLMHSSKDKNSWRLNFLRWRLIFSALLPSPPPLTYENVYQFTCAKQKGSNSSVFHRPL